MAIKNTNLGGADWTAEQLKAVDINDTFDAAWDKIKTLSAFWLNSDLYTMIEDFNTYSTGAFTTDASWDVTENTNFTGTAATTISGTTNAGGANSKEIKMTVGMNESSGNASLGEITVIELANAGSNEHVTCKYHTAASRNDSDVTNTITISVGNPTDGWTSIVSMNGGGGNPNIIMCVAKGGNNYDIYNGGKLVSAALTKANGIRFKFYIKVHGIDGQGTTTLYVDDIFKSANAII